MKYPEDLETPLNIVQQIQISHNFVESYIITNEENWNSISFYNPNKEMVIVLVLDKYDNGNDYKEVLAEFNKELEKYPESEEAMKTNLEKVFNLSLRVFRTTDEVILKLSNEVMNLKLKLFDMEERFKKILKSKRLSVRNKILLLLIQNDQLTLKDLKKVIKASDSWVNTVIKSLLKEEIIAYNPNRDSYYLMF
ncbi:MAG: hypothetical protein ACTSYC_10135 [Promethearchaeota archaeon]